MLDWSEQYGEMGFSFTEQKKSKASRKYMEVTIKAKNGKTLKTSIGRRFGDGKEELAKTFNKFIEENKI